MSNRSAIVVAEMWLYETLHGDATLMAAASDVHSEAIEEGESLPAVVYQLMTPTNDATFVNSERAWSTLNYLVKAIGDTASLVALNTIVARIDTLLHKQSGSPTTGGTVLSCVRVRPVSYTERVSGKARGQYRHLGGIYRLDVQE